MKKHTISLTAIFFAFMMHATAASATTYSFQPLDADLADLDHHTTYEWGLQLNLEEGEVVTGASLFFDNIANWQVEPNDLFLNLLNGSPAGVTNASDNELQKTNYFTTDWVGEGIELNQYTNLPTTPQDLTYNFDTPELSTLYAYLLDDGIFGIGLDPDCHFWNDGISLTINTETNPVPIPGAVWLLGSGLTGLVGLRRRKNV